MTWIKILFPMIIVLTGNNHCLKFQNITYRESCGNNILVLPLEPNIYEYPQEEFTLVKGKFLYGGSIIYDILFRKSWTLIDSFSYNYSKNHYLTFAGFVSVVHQNEIMIDYISEVKNTSNIAENIILYDLVSKNIINYETVIMLNDNIYTTGEFHEIYNQKGEYTIQLLGKVINGQACSCPSLGDGFLYGRSLIGWITDIVDEKKNKNQL